MSDESITTERHIFPTFDAFADSLFDLLRQEHGLAKAARMYRYAESGGVFNDLHDAPTRWNAIEVNALRKFICRQFLADEVLFARIHKLLVGR